MEMIMKLEVDDILDISSAAGKYKTKVIEVRMARAADNNMYEWYLCENQQKFTSTGEMISPTAYFNENLADNLVKQVTREVERV